MFYLDYIFTSHIYRKTFFFAQMVLQKPNQRMAATYFCIRQAEIRLLKRAKSWYTDGILFVTSKPFYQLYIILHTCFYLAWRAKEKS
jgi:hypothetical protein